MKSGNHTVRASSYTHEPHGLTHRATPLSEDAVEKSARIFRALAEPARIRLVSLLATGAACVSELAKAESQSVTVISQRLRVLRSENIVRRVRDGKHILYSLADQHVLDLVNNCLAHASEGAAPKPTAPNKTARGKHA